MAAKVLLGVVALAAIVGSPIAYNHLSSSSGETQKEGEQANVVQPSVEPQKPASSDPVARAPEVQEDRQDTNEQAPLPGRAPAAKGEDVPRNQNSVQADAPANPRSDECQLGGTNSWSDVPTLSPQMNCVRGQVKGSRTPN